MKAIIIFVCLFTNRVTSQSADVFPGKIFSSHKNISEGSEIIFKCSPHGSGKSSTSLYLYLCKDGQGIQRKRQKQDQTDIIFTVNSVKLYDSGNYSCVYSPKGYEPSNIFKSGSNTFAILVKAAFLPAQISMVGSSTVTEGDIFELQCTVDANMVQKHTECTHIRSYLMRNNTVVRMEAFSIKDTKATFAIQDATLRDSGQYSCVVFPSRCVREEDAKFRGNNTLTVHVEENVSYWGVVGMGLLSTLMILFFFLFIIVKQRQIFTGKYRFHQK
ncbi:T-cell-interacting, activating receptor on myeloid cells protein 1 [Nelusetta ayraudi]|uniref:T-cell-interacting, activating receptor on myeloid cells protein 1 n=1 Tax=Nelusetta ayraudi TaxID=303726 RepID=UPI003F6F6728